MCGDKIKRFLWRGSLKIGFIIFVPQKIGHLRSNFYGLGRERIGMKNEPERNAQVQMKSPSHNQPRGRKQRSLYNSDEGGTTSFSVITERSEARVGLFLLNWRIKLVNTLETDRHVIIVLVKCFQEAYLR